MREPEIGWVMVERSGHSWERAPDGLWYCGCDTDQGETRLGWTWKVVMDDIGLRWDSDAIAELRSPPDRQ